MNYSRLSCVFGWLIHSPVRSLRIVQYKIITEFKYRTRVFYDFQAQVPRSLSSEGPRREFACSPAVEWSARRRRDKVQNARTASHYTRIVHSHSQSPHANPPLSVDAHKIFCESLQTFSLGALCVVLTLRRERAAESSAHGSPAECSL
jgi:hypothetical protein